MNEMTLVDQGIALAEAGDDPIEAKRRKEESDEVRRMLGDIEAARAFDKAAREQFAVDRMYARGGSTIDFEVMVNLIGSYIDTLAAFLYARDPDVSARPKVRTTVDTQQPPTMPMPPSESDVLLDPGLLMHYQQAQTQYRQDLQAYQQQREARRAETNQRKRFAETLEIVVGSLWQQGKLKHQARRWVRSGLTIGIGWLKVSWMERRGQDPVVLGKVRDLQDNIQRLHATEDALLTAAGVDRERLQLDYQRQLEGLNARVEVIVSRGLAIDLVAAEDITVAIGVPSVMQYLDAPWIDHRIFLRVDDAVAQFPGIDAEKIKKATKYGQRKPKRVKANETGDSPTEADAEMFRPGTEGATTTSSGAAAPDFVCIHETWNLDKNMIFTAIEGVDCWACPPSAPSAATSRFYPYFALAFIEVDGERYPQSKTARAAKLQDEFNRTRSNFAEHRRRSLPGIIFDKGLLEVEGADALQKAVINELIGIQSTNPNIPVGNLFTSKPVSPIDGALYSTDPIRRDLEEIFGAQQAMQGSISQPKTATEAQIQQQGFGTRTESDRDCVDEALSAMAQYTAEIAVQKLDGDAVQALAGPDYIWPINATVEDLSMLVDIRIRAGSSGKPDTSSDRQAWAQTMPLMQQLIMQVGAMRGALPGEMADKLEELGRITLSRAGDSIDIDTLMPMGDGMPIPQTPPGAAPGAPAV